MLYVGRNDDVSTKVRLEARAATCSKGTNGDHSTTAWPIVVDAPTTGPAR